METLAEKVKNIASAYASSKVCVAVSGGSDSMCLLHCLLRDNIIDKRKISVVNVDHSIRGAESERDSIFVKKFCDSHGLNVIFRKVDIPALAAENGRSMETEARIFRRALFDEIVSTGLADIIFTAHNSDDNSETLLMHIFRGCGLRGLVGMKARDGNICRPLLTSDKSEILEYMSANGVPFVEDSTNADDKYTRNFIRLRVLPLIKSRYTGIGSALSRLSYLAENALERAEDWEKDGDSVTVPLSSLDGQNVRSAIIAVGLETDYTADNIASVLRLETAETGTGVDLPHGYRAERESDCVRLFPKTEACVYEEPFAVGTTCSKGYYVRVTPCRPYVPKRGTAIDIGKVPTNAVVRTRKEGDRFRPIGGKEKSLSDWLIDKKIPRYERRRLLYIASGAEVLCIVGVATGEKLKIDEDTANAALVSAVRAGEDL